MTRQTMQSQRDAIRRHELRRLDLLLAELEALNLKDAGVLPDRLSNHLRAAGIGHRRSASITETIDLVFKAQERYLQPMVGNPPNSSAA